MKKKLSFGSKIKVLKKEGNFYKFDYFWINKKDLKKINYKGSFAIESQRGKDINYQATKNYIFFKKLIKKYITK